MARHAAQQADVGNLLIVEDNDIDREVLKRALRGQAQIRESSTLEEAIENLARGEADCIVADLGLPDAMGTEVVRTLRRVAPNAALIVYTGESANDARALEMLRAGADDFLVKGCSSAREIARSLQFAIERTSAVRGQQRQTSTFEAALELSGTEVFEYSVGGQRKARLFTGRALLGHSLPLLCKQAGANWLERLVVPEELERFQQTLDTLMTGEVLQVRFTHHFRPAHGPPKHILGHLKASQSDGQGRPTRILGTICALDS